MVAHADTTTLPPLTTEDKLRLHLYFTNHQSLELLAQHLAQHLASSCSPSLREGAGGREHSETPNTPSTTAPSNSPPHSVTASLSHSVTSPPITSPPDQFALAHWLLSESIAPHIAFHRTVRENSDKQLVIQTLKELISTAENPTEKRRAATTLLRALSTQLTRSRTPQQPTRTVHSEPSGARGGRRSIPSINEPLLASPHLPIPQSPPPPPLSIPEAFSQGEIKTPSDCPLPDPARLPEDVIAAALHAIQNPDTPSTDSGPITLFNLSGILKDRTQASLDEFKGNALFNWIKDSWHFRSAGEIAPLQYEETSMGTRVRTTVPITLYDGVTVHFKFELERPTSGTLAHCWLLRFFICDRRSGPNTS